MRVEPLMRWLGTILTRIWNQVQMHAETKALDERIEWICGSGKRRREVETVAKLSRMGHIRSDR